VHGSGTAILLLAALSPLRAAAQDPDSLPRIPPAGAVSADSAEAYLRLQADARVRVPAMPDLEPRGPQPATARLRFTRDSIDWSGAATVGDLLTGVPGVHLWRGGGIGRPEPADFRARGGSSAEYYLDGMPYVAAGPDSIAVDPALFPLGLLDRVEIERWPGLLRVHLFTRRHDRLAAASHLVLGAGPEKFAMYRGTLERRFGSGLGFGAGADYVKAPAAGSIGLYQNTQYWIQGSYVPSARFGTHVQYLGATPDRDAFGGTLSTGERHEGRRSELQARLFFGGRPDGTGARLDLVYARTAFDSAGIDQTFAQIGGAASVRSATWAARAAAFHRTRWTPLDASVSASWSPATALTVAGEGVYRRHDGDRNARWVGVRAGLGLPGGLSLTGTARTGDDVAAPSLLASPVQEIAEAEGTVGWNLSWIGVEASLARTKSFAPPSFQPYPGIVAILPSGQTDWVTLSGRLSPLGWFSVRGWYSDPRTATPEGSPPRHYAGTATIRSKFLRRFPSGALDLKLEVGVEGWQAGVLGRDAGGGEVGLPAAQFVRGLIQLQLESFSVFWESRNLTNEPNGYVPGFRVPRYNGFFGVRWEFSN
jgi:hypothetical protein